MASQTTSVFNPAQFAQESTQENPTSEETQTSEQNQEVLYNITGNSSRDQVRKMFWEIFENTPDEVGNTFTNIQIVQAIEEKLFEVSQGDPRSRSYRDKSRQLQLKLKGPRFDLPRKQIKRGEVSLDEICSDTYLNSKAPTTAPGQSAAIPQMAGRGRGGMVPPIRGRGGPILPGQAGRGGPSMPGVGRAMPIPVQQIPKQEPLIPQIQNEDNNLQIEQQKIVEQPVQQIEKPQEPETQDIAEKQVIEIKQNVQTVQEKEPLVQQSEEIKEVEIPKINEIEQPQPQVNLPPPRLPPQQLPMRGRGGPPPMRGAPMGRGQMTRPPIQIPRPQVTQLPLQKNENTPVDQKPIQEIKLLTPKFDENETSKVELEFPNTSLILENNEISEIKEDNKQEDSAILNFDKNQVDEVHSPDIMETTSLVASSTDLKPGAVQNKLPLFGASLDDTIMSEGSEGQPKRKKVKKIKKKKKLINESNDNQISQNINEDDEEDDANKRYDMPLQMKTNDDNLKFKLQNQLKDHSNQDNNQLQDQTILSPKNTTPQLSATELVQQVSAQLEKISVAQENRSKIKDKLADDISQGIQRSVNQFATQENDELKKLNDILFSKKETINNLNFKIVQLESEQAIKDKKLGLFQDENLKLKREIAEYKREAEEAREELYQRNSQVSNQNNQLKRALREREDALNKQQIELQHIRQERDMYQQKSQQIFRDSQIQRDKCNRLITAVQGNGGMFNDNFYSQFDIKSMPGESGQNLMMSQNQGSNNNTINSASNNQEMNLQKELIEMRHRYEQILKEQQQELESRTRDLEKVERINNKFRENQRILTNAVQSLDNRSNQVMAGGGSGSQTADNQFINFEQIIQNMDEEFTEIVEVSGAGESANIETQRHVSRPPTQIQQNQYEMGSTLIDSAEFINSNPPEDTIEEQKVQNRSGRNSIASSQQSLAKKSQDKQINPPNNQSQIEATNFKNSTHQQQYDASA